MKLFNKKIARGILALTLVIFTCFSLSSCFFDVGIYRDMLDSINEQEKENTPTPPDPTPDENNNNNNNDNDNKLPDILGGVPSDEYPAEMYPGSGSASLDNVDSLRKSLLSSVIVLADNTLNPSTGAGVIYQLDKENGDAYIITNFHVVYDKGTGLCDDIKVFLYGMVYENYAIPATLVGGSSTYDIAVLRVRGSEILKNSYATPITLGSSEAIRPFDAVYTVGNPEGHGFAVTEGIVSVESEQLTLEGADGTPISLRVIRVDAAVNHGNSGGGLFNKNGELVGIVSAKRIGTDVDNMGYAIPSDLVYYLIENILYNCNGVTNIQMKKALMGITISSFVSGVIVDPVTGDFKKAELVEVIDVSEGATAYGKVLVGDIVNSITVDGKTVEVTRMHHVTDLMLTARLGSKVALNITRDGEALVIEFEITESAITTVN